MAVAADSNSRRFGAALQTSRARWPSQRSHTHLDSSLGFRRVQNRWPFFIARAFHVHVTVQLGDSDGNVDDYGSGGIGTRPEIEPVNACPRASRGMAASWKLARSPVAAVAAGFRDYSNVPPGVSHWPSDGTANRLPHPAEPAAPALDTLASHRICSSCLRAWVSRQEEVYEIACRFDLRSALRSPVRSVHRDCDNDRRRHRFNRGCYPPCQGDGDEQRRRICVQQPHHDGGDLVHS